eukprot:s279_g19.t1
MFERVDGGAKKTRRKVCISWQCIACGRKTKGENSDDEDDTEDLVVSASDLAHACDTHVPATEGDMKKGKWSAHRSLIVDAIERAETHWKPLPCEPCALPNPCQGLDSNSLLRSLRRKTRSSNFEGDSCVREPEVQQEIVNITCSNEKSRRRMGPGRCRRMQRQTSRSLQKSCRPSCAGDFVGKPYGARAFAVGCAWRTWDKEIVCADLNGDTIHHAFGLSWLKALAMSALASTSFWT